MTDAARKQIDALLDALEAATGDLRLPKRLREAVGEAHGHVLWTIVDMEREGLDS